MIIQSQLISNNKKIYGNDIFVRYLDNVIIPQNDLPIVNVEMARIPLVAKPRRVAIYYSQIAA